MTMVDVVTVISHLLVLFLIVRIEVRDAAQYRMVCRVHRLILVWSETWGQPSEEVKKLLQETSRERRIT